MLPVTGWCKKVTREAEMAATLDPITQAGVGALGGVVEVTAQQVSCGHLVVHPTDYLIPREMLTRLA